MIEIQGRSSFISNTILDLVKNADAISSQIESKTSITDKLDDELKKIAIYENILEKL